MRLPANSQPPRNSDGLYEPGTANEPISYLKRVLGLRQYIWVDAVGTVEAEHVSTRFGRVWLYVEPLLDMAIWFLIFGVAIRADRDVPGDVSFLVYLVVGMTIYGLMQDMFDGARRSLKRSRSIALDFPRAVTVVSGYARHIYRFRYRLAIMILLLLLSGVAPRLSWLLLIPIALLGILVAAGIGFGLARIGVTQPSTDRVLGRLLRFLFWTSGVMVPIEGYLIRLDQSETTLAVFGATNPLYGTVKLFQWAASGYRAPQVEWALLATPLWALVLPLVGFAWMVRGEALYRKTGSRYE